MLDDCLALHCHSRDPSSDIWILKQHDDWNSWVKSFTLSVVDLSIYNITPTRKFLVWDDRLKVCKIIDPSKDNQEQPKVDVYCPSVEMVSGAGNYVESLILPFSTIKLTRD